MLGRDILPRMAPLLVHWLLFEAAHGTMLPVSSPWGSSRAVSQIETL